MVSKPETGADVVRLARPDVGEEELAEIREVLESGQLTMGPKVLEFEALLKILEREEAIGQVFNVGNPRSVVTVFDLAARIKRLSGSDSEIVFKPLHYTDVEMRIPNVDKARKQLGWEPQVDLDDGLERTIAWYRERQPVQSLAPSA